MSQLLKHYFINRETGSYATNTPYGLMMPSIRGLEIVHQLFDENNIPYCLSTCPEYFEHSVTVSQDQLTEYQNNPNITIVSSVEREVEVQVENPETFEPTGETTTVTVYDVIYQELYILNEVDGLEIITQQEWDSEISNFDTKQEEKRYDLIRKIRDELLLATDWIVIKAEEQQETLDLDFKTWRQDLRNIPNGETFPTGFPTLPTLIENNSKVLELYSRWSEVVSISMINDPLIVQ